MLSFSSLLTHIQALLVGTTVEEWLVIASIPLFAIGIGQQFARRVEQMPKASKSIELLEFASPLFVPATAMVITFVAITLFYEHGTPAPLLVFSFKVYAALLSIRLISRMIERRIAGWFLALVFIPVTVLKLFGLLDDAMLLLESVRFSIGSLELNLYNVTTGVIALVLLQWGASLTVRTVDARLAEIKDMRASNRSLAIKLFSFVLYFFVFIFGLQLLGINLTALGFFGGALGIGLGFGMRQITSNFISGIILLSEKSIEIGDMIEMQDGTLGYVRQTYARYTRLEMTNGKEILIPNEEFIIQRVVSWTHTNKKAQLEINVLVAYDSDIPLARKLMLAAAENAHNGLPGSEISCHLTSFEPSGVQLRLQFWVKDITSGRSESKSKVMLAIMNAFKEHQITIPYPQQEVRIVNLPTPEPQA